MALLLLVLWVGLRPQGLAGLLADVFWGDVGGAVERPDTEGEEETCCDAPLRVVGLAAELFRKWLPTLEVG